MCSRKCWINALKWVFVHWFRWLSFWSCYALRRQCCRRGHRCTHVEIADDDSVVTNEGCHIEKLPPLPSHHIRITAVSDFHGHLEWVGIPTSTDVLVCSGDLTFLNGWGQPSIAAFAREVGAIRRRCTAAGHVLQAAIVTAGNHDKTLERRGAQWAQDVLAPSLYLENAAADVNVTLANGRTGVLKTYGCPNTPRSHSDNSAFQFPYKSAELQAVYERIPAGLDVLVCHQDPSYCAPLAQVIQARAPRLVICGHIHGAHGVKVVRNAHNGTTTVKVNASVASNDCWNWPTHPAVVIDLPVRHLVASDDSASTAHWQ